MGKVLLEARGVSKRFCRRPEFALRYAAQDMRREMCGRPPRNDLRPGEFWALADVDLHLESGEVLGVIGHNGAGKSTLINLAAGLLLPTQGTMKLYTNRVALMDHQGGLNMIQTGTENIADQLTLHGCPASRMESEIQSVCEFAELGEFIHAPVGTYSLGMRLRLAFSIYTRMQPDLFIVDEALNGGDLRFRRKFQQFIRGYIDGGGSILLCSHDLFIIQTLCRRCLLLDGGRVVKSGDVVEVVHSYHEIMRESARSNGLKANATRDCSDDSRPAAAKDIKCAGKADLEWVFDDCQKLTVEAILVRSPGGGPVRPGGAVEIEIKCVAAEDLTDVCCAVEIGNGDFFPITTLTGGYPVDSMTIRAGSSSLLCGVECFTLAPGQYDVRVVISDVRTGAILTMSGYEDQPATFEVVAERNATANILQYRRNLIHLTAAWR
jgi:lipopolysaccharide transport system ATP-binding protein